MNYTFSRRKLVLETEGSIFGGFTFRKRVNGGGLVYNVNLDLLKTTENRLQFVQLLHKSALELFVKKSRSAAKSQD